MGLTKLFKHKETGRKVIYKDICIHEDIVTEESTDPSGILYKIDKENIEDCILCKDDQTHQYYSIPIVQFLNYYEPDVDTIEQAIDVLEKLKVIDDERNKENIHSLYSRKPKTNPKRPTK